MSNKTLLVVIDPETDRWLRDEAEENGQLVAELAGELLTAFVELIRSKRQSTALEQADRFREG